MFHINFAINFTFFVYCYYQQTSKLKVPHYLIYYELLFVKYLRVFLNNHQFIIISFRIISPGEKTHVFYSPGLLK